MIFGGKDAWIWWDWVTRNTDEILDALRQHLWYTLLAVGIGFVISLPLGIFIQRRRRSAWARCWPSPGSSTRSPSLAAFALLVAWLGPLQPVDGADPADRLQPVHPHPGRRRRASTASTRPCSTPRPGMGYRPTRRLLQVELPLAMPSIMAGLRLATVTTVGLVTVTAVLGPGRASAG